MRKRVPLLFGRSGATLALAAIVAASAACGRGAPESAPELALEGMPSLEQPAWSNGNFESNNIGDAPTGWTVTNAQNLGVLGSPSTLPSDQNDLDLRNVGA